MFRYRERQSTFCKNNKLSKISRASSAGIDDFNQWILSNLSETIFNNDGITDDYSRYKIEKTKVF